MSFFCNRCGGGLPGSARFCSNCGAVIPVTQPTQGRQLVRPLMGRRVAGVCIGLAQAYGWDVALVRLFTVLGCFFSGGVVAVAYVAGWIGIPEEPIALPGAYPPGI
jgi:phage shock protein C